MRHLPWLLTAILLATLSHGTSAGEPLGVLKGRRRPDATAGPGSPLWVLWWEINRPIDRDAFRHGSGFDCDDDCLHPDARETYEVETALLAALERERTGPVVASALTALARIGERPDWKGATPVHDALSRHLAHPDPSAAEAAVVGLGILGSEASLPILRSLLADDERARELAGTAIDPRRRVLAALGLGLFGALPENRSVRPDVVAALHAALSSADPELARACVIALGSVPLEPDGPLARSAGDVPTTRRGQIDVLLEVLADESADPLVRAQVPVALAHLWRPPGFGSPLSEERAPDTKTLLVNTLLALLEEEAEEPLGRACVVALGLLGDADADPLDVRIRGRLTWLGLHSIEPEVFGQAFVALARIAGDPGHGGEAAPGIAEVGAYLLDRLGHASDQKRPWAALALGLLGENLQRQAIGAPIVARARTALRRALRPTWDGSASGLALALLGDRDASELLRPLLSNGMLPDEDRGLIALALALLGDQASRELLRETVRGAKYRPGLLAKAALCASLLRDEGIIDELTTIQDASTGLAVPCAVARALGRTGQRLALAPLCSMLGDADAHPLKRACAASALGDLADQERLPWFTRIVTDLVPSTMPHALLTSRLGGMPDLR